MPETYSLSQLNQMNQEKFTAVLGAIFEDSPWIAAEAWQKRPFSDLDSLYKAMVAVVEQSDVETQLTLIRSHPDLGSKAKMAPASVKEQAGVGLDQLSEAEYNRLLNLNQAYKDKFNFPFIIAVKKQTKESIFEAFERRLNNSSTTEIKQALTEIATIAELRIREIIH